MFVRFVVGDDGEHHKAMSGLFTHAYRLRDSGTLDSAETVMVEASFAWFNEHVRVPPFPRDWPTDAISWFRAEAVEAVRRMWVLAHALEAHGQPVRMLPSSNPGRVLYEDEHQIVVAEWNAL